MEQAKLEQLRSLASEIQKDVVRMVGVAHSWPLGASLSLADLLVFLYWQELVILPSQPRKGDRDRFVLGIEAAAPLLYAVLAARGYFEREELWHYRRLGAMLQALPDCRRTPGIDSPCVTAGSPLSVAAAASASLNGGVSAPRVFCLLDGRSLLQEDFGPEAKRAAAGKLGNLVLMVHIDVKMPRTLYENGAGHLRNMGWSVFTANGWDLLDIEQVFSALDFSDRRPKAVFIKAAQEEELSFVVGTKRRKFMNAEEMDQALEELEGRSHES